MELFGNIAVVTHAATRLGLITARALYQAGVFVYLVDSNDRRGREACETLVSYGHILQKRKFFRVDFCDAPLVTPIAQKILSENEGIDIFVNVSAPKSCSEDKYSRDLLHSFLPSMIKNGRGKIINVTDGREPAERVVAASMAAGDDQRATSNFVFEMARHGISVNDICVELNQVPENAPLQYMECKNDIPGIGSSEDYPLEIADATLLFARSSSNHITGQTLHLHC